MNLKLMDKKVAVLLILFLGSLSSLVITLIGIKDAEKSIQRLTVQVEEMKNTVKELTQERDYLRGEVTSLNTVIANLEAEVDRLNKASLASSSPTMISPPATPPISRLPIITEGVPKVIAQTEIFFDVNSYKVSSAGAEEIRKIAKIISSYNNKVNVIIKGFTDPTGPKEWNAKLSKERADQVYFRLTNLAGDPIKKCELTVAGLGEAKNGDPKKQRVVKILVTECK